MKQIACILGSGALVFGAWGCGGSTPPSSSPETLAATTSQEGNSETGMGASAGTNPDATLGARTAPLTDAQIAAITDSVNSAEIEQAEIAQNKSTNDQVRSFAAMMIAHHGQAKSQQTALKLDAAQSPLSQQLAQESRATLETLKAKNGSDFDRAYMQAQVEGHQKALDTIKNDLQPSARDPELRSYLESLTPQVAEHLEQAKAAQESLQNGGSTPRPTSSR